MRASMSLICAILLAGCGSTDSPRATSEARSTIQPAGPSCTIPPKTYADLAACRGESEQISLEIADSFQGKSVVRIAIASRDPQAILAAMGDATRQWSIGANSFTVFAYAAAGDYAAGAGYNRGRIYWNDGGPITVNVCTSYIDLGDGIDFCDEESEYIVENQ